MLRHQCLHEFPAFEERAVNLKRREGHRAMLPVRKSCRLDDVSEWSCPALGLAVFWGVVKDGEMRAHICSYSQEGFGMGRSCQGFEEGPVLTVLVLSHIPAGAAAAAAPFFSSCLQRFVWRKCSGDWILLQNTEAIRFSLFISRAFCSMKAGIQTTRTNK